MKVDINDPAVRKYLAELLKPLPPPKKEKEKPLAQPYVFLWYRG